MAEELQVFKYTDFSVVRVVEINGEPWFMGKDVAEILGYTNSSAAINRHIDTDDKKLFYFLASQNVTPESNNNSVTIINESGLYSLILSSKKSEAKKFKHWVTSEVLPAIRKTGKYISDSVSKTVTPEWYCDRKNVKALLLALDNTQEENEILKVENVEQRKQISEMKPKAEYCDNVLQSDGLLLVSQIANDYPGWSARRLNKFLKDKGIQYKRNDQWIICVCYAKEGYVQSKTTIDRNGISRSITMWTQKGREFIHQLLASEGILPTVKCNEQPFLKLV